MNLVQNLPVRLNQVHIKNYKGIDDLIVDFPHPDFEDESDIFIVGGKNGAGKSSLLECCALILLAPKFKKIKYPVYWELLNERVNQLKLRLSDLLVKSGSDITEIIGKVEHNNEISTVHLTIDDECMFINSKIDTPIEELAENHIYLNEIDNLCTSICNLLGDRKDPVISNTFLFFHSFRSMSYDAPRLTRELNRKLNEESRWSEQPFNLFKETLLNSLLARANLLELKSNSPRTKNGNITKEEDVISLNLNFLTEIVKEYAEGEIHKLMPLPHSASYDLRIENENKSYSIDALGSGHKEIISTLFLISFYTSSEPKVILLDEPELHFNKGWHKKFLAHATRNPLTKRPYVNQYILATHSSAVMDFIDKENNRIILK